LGKHSILNAQKAHWLTDLVLMLPGMGALRSEYRYLAPKLGEARYRTVTGDLRRHGESSVPWKTCDVPSVGNGILALIEHLNAGPAHVIATPCLSR
jgi:pimeloyl-ACP methyl ester carboxylesterase